MKVSFKTLLSLIAIIGLVMVFACVAGRPMFKPVEELPQIPFDEATWKKAKYDYKTNTESDVRGQMTDDLLKCYNFKGWTCDQVIALLGESDSLGELKEEWDLIYGLGRGTSNPLQIDYRNLGFKLDSQGRVISFGFFLH